MSKSITTHVGALYIYDKIMNRC